MPMFGGAVGSDLEDPAPTTVATTVDLEEASPTPEVQPIEAPAIAPEVKKPASKAKPKQSMSKKKDGRAASWQKYTRPGVKNESIPDAVRLILETQPEKDFKIVEVMDALFQEDMPKSQYLKARNRISNVLSGGVRAGDWHRGDRTPTG